MVDDFDEFVKEENWELERRYRLYDNKTGEYYEVCPDADTGELISIRERDVQKRIMNRMVFPVGCISELITALQNAKSDIKRRDDDQ